MARTNVNYDKKRIELLDKIWDVFLENGYENTTLSLIIKELNISKGAFYHYFSTKEACADAAVKMYAENCYQKLQEQIKENIAADANFKNLIYSCSQLFSENERSLERVNTPANAIFHQKLMVALVKELAPLFAKVISYGVSEKTFDTKYPLETAQMILTLSNFFFDADLFGWEAEEMPSKLLAFENLLTLTLKAEPGTFLFFSKN